MNEHLSFSWMGKSKQNELFKAWQMAHLNEQGKTMMIPKIVHQIWYNMGKGSVLPFEYHQQQKSVKQMCRQNGWVYILWDETMSLQLLKSLYDDFTPLFMSYKSHIYRVDAIRYFILHAFGGVYLDMDLEVFQSLDFLIRPPRQCVFTRTTTTKSNLSNYMMASCKGHELMEEMIQKLKLNHSKWWHVPKSHFTTMNIAGPWFLEKCVKTYLHNQGLPNEIKTKIKETIYAGNICILPCGCFHQKSANNGYICTSQDVVYGNHDFDNGWGKMILFDGLRLYFFILISLFVVLFFILLGWYIKAQFFETRIYSPKLYSH